jgi:hypothetical protein
MDMRDDWHVKIVLEDALVFKAAPDGTVTMRAVPRKQWETLLAGHAIGGSGRSMGDKERRVGRASGVVGGASAGTTRYFEAAPSFRA